MHVPYTHIYATPQLSPVCFQLVLQCSKTSKITIHMLQYCLFTSSIT